MLRPTERVQVHLKNCTKDFQNNPSLERSACFYKTISEKFEHFRYFIFETDFLENENIFQKTGVLFVVGNTKIEKTSIPYKSDISEANVKTNRMVTTK